MVGKTAEYTIISVVAMKSKTKRSQPSKKNTSNRIRIIGGQWRGRKLSVVATPDLRPTGDRIRETLFSWLATDIAGSHCVDLFAGSGILGFECLSRGASTATFLEQNPIAAQRLRQHCELLDAEKTEVIQQNCLIWLKHTDFKKQSIPIIFVDPPFNQNLWQAAIEQIIASRLLAKNAKIYIETPKGYPLDTPADWQLYRKKIAGEVCYRLYQASSH